MVILDAITFLMAFLAVASACIQLWSMLQTAISAAKSTDTRNEFDGAKLMIAYASSAGTVIFTLVTFGMLILSKAVQGTMK